MFAAIINPLAILLSLSTATGIFVHDMRIDKAATAVLSLPSIVTSYQGNTKLVDFSTDAHTHVERASLNQALQELRTQNPHIQPRSSDDKRHARQKTAGRGHHAFGNTNLPLV